ALHSPLLNDNDIYKSKKILFNIYENPNDPIRIEEMAEVETFMAKFREDDSELIWGYSKDHNLDEGAVKVTVLATGFGMKDIPGMEPVINEEEKVKEEITRAKQEIIEKENRELEKMVNVFYKSEYKVYIFKGDEMFDDEFIEALDNSPTYKRTMIELEKIVDRCGQKSQATSPSAAEQAPAENVGYTETAAETAEVQHEEFENPVNENIE
ncbi:MAG: hypothetical protein J6U62_02865, partial [Bacteroidaceae bacterium]|nr:hypothetical protein [Bacteroidaceae bacterium]